MNYTKGSKANTNGRGGKAKKKWKGQIYENL